MKQKKEREKEISQWPWISMLPFGILAGYWGDKEVRITAISEYGFQTRLAAPATADAEKRALGTGILRSENSILPADSSS